MVSLCELHNVVRLVRGSKRLRQRINHTVDRKHCHERHERRRFRPRPAMEIMQNFSESGNYLNEIISRAEKLNALKGPLVFTIVASRSHMSPETEQLINSYKEKNGEIALISIGSSLKLCLVAEGAAHVYPRLAPTMEWDTAAGHAVAIFAGKKVNNFNTGLPMQYNKENLLNPWFIVE